MKGYIYILINPSFPGLLKIGKTTKNPEERARELSSTSGVPTRYDVVWDELVSDCDQVEYLVHKKFSDRRIRKEREFFAITIKEAISILSNIVKPFLCQPDISSSNNEMVLQLQNKPTIKPNKLIKPRPIKEELILVAEDSKVTKGIEPPVGEHKTIARYTYEVLKDNDYRFTEEELFVEVHMNLRNRRGLKLESYNIKRSLLVQKFGWGIHRNKEGKLALVEVNSKKYITLMNTIRTVKSYRKSKI